MAAPLPHSAAVLVLLLVGAAVLVGILIGVLIAVLIGVLVVILIAVLVLILILVVHIRFLRYLFSQRCCVASLPGISGFILGLEDQACGKPGENGSGDPSGSGFQAAGKDTWEALGIYLLVDNSFCCATL